MKIPFFNLKLTWGSEPKSLATPSYYNSRNLSVLYDGENTPYELGNPYDFSLDYYSLRARSWEAFLKTDVVQNAIFKYCLWIVGSGLKLQSEPNELILNFLDRKELGDFSQNIEARFRTYANSKECTYSKEDNLHGLASEALKNALLAGDVLCINRVMPDGRVVLDIIDGYFVCNPLGSQWTKDVQERGNKIIDGVEIDSKGSHVAYYIAKEDFQYERILAYGVNSGRRMAWLFYGRKHKLGDTRGMSLLSAVLENASKLDRYKDATVGTAEENAKIPYTIEHLSYSDGENPFVNQLAQTMGSNKGTAPETEMTDEVSAGIASKIARSTSKMTYNLPRGAQLKRNEYKSDNQFKDFFLVNIDILYATLGIPAEVALDKFGGSYSSSRAALKSWEYSMLVNRTNLLKNQFYKPFFDLWIDVNILQNKIKVKGYLEALSKVDYMTIEAFKNCRFIGQTVPHIDPVKEVNAERLKLGESFKNIPLSTAEQSCENLNTGDFEGIIKKAENEQNISSYFVVDDNNDSDKSDDI